MGLPWVRMDSTFPHNRKILQLVDARKHRAISLYVFALAWSGHQATDGHIPSYALPVIHGTRRDASDLVAAGLWMQADDGWCIHDWDEYQPSAAYRDRNRAALDKARCTKAMNGGDPCTCGQHR